MWGEWNTCLAWKLYSLALGHKVTISKTCKSLVTLTLSRKSILWLVPHTLYYKGPASLWKIVRYMPYCLHIPSGNCTFFSVFTGDKKELVIILIIIGREAKWSATDCCLTIHMPFWLWYCTAWPTHLWPRGRVQAFRYDSLIICVYGISVWHKLFQPVPLHTFLQLVPSSNNLMKHIDKNKWITSPQQTDYH
jgi:hypothetical protein